MVRRDGDGDRFAARGAEGLAGGAEIVEAIGSWRCVPLALAIGMYKTAIYDLQGGAHCSREKLEKVCAFLKINWKWLESGEGQMFDSNPPEPPAEKLVSRKGAKAQSKKPEKKSRTEERESEPSPSPLMAALRRASNAAAGLEALKAELREALAEIRRLEEAA
jgi:hypothetical protein